MNKKLVILGAGESGIGAALLGKKQGYELLVSDANQIDDRFKKELNAENIPFEEKGHSEEKVLAADVVVKSPGIPFTAKIIKAVQAKGIELIGEIEFAFQFTDEKIIAVTGSNGKTTVATWVFDVLKRAEIPAHLSGNIGKSFAREVAEQKKGIYILEISSFQLDSIKNFRPDIAVLTSLSPDHLDRYEYDFQKYVNAKFRITENQNDENYFVYDADNEVIAKEIKKRNLKPNQLPMSFRPFNSDGACLENNQLNILTNDTEFNMTTDNLALKGEHNAKNAMAASTVAHLLKIRKQTIRESLERFQGVEHRLEEVLKINNVLYINDSKGTNVNAVIYAMESVKPETIWIVGGEDKGNNYSELLPLVNEKVKAIICIGRDNSKIKETFGNCIDYLAEAETMHEAVGLAYQISESGNTVLLSPACASFDRFENFEDRGRQFKNSVRNL